MSIRRGVLSLVVVAWTISQIGGASAQAVCSGNRSDLFQNPFSRASAHHRPIGTGAVYASATHAATLSWRKAAHFNINAGAPFGVHMVLTGPGDPIRSIAAKATCDRVVNLPAAVRLPAGGLVTNIQTSPSGCPDGDIVVHDSTTGVGHHLRQYNHNGGNPTAGQYRTVNVRGLGHGTRPGERIGSYATGIAAPFGLLRGHEINTPGRTIQHALQIVLPRKPGTGCNIMLSRTILLPATSADGNANSPGNNTGNIPYGGLLALPPAVNLNSLGLSEPGRRLAEAIRNYGIYVVDGGGCAAGAIRSDQTVSSTIRNQLRTDIRKIYPHIRLVLNNNVLGNPVAGGGTPLAPNCAFDASS